MKQYFLNPQTQEVVEIEVRDLQHLHILRKKYRTATPRQRLDYLNNVIEVEKQQARALNLQNIFYMAPTHNRDGYGTTAFNMKRRAVKYGYWFNKEPEGQKVGLCYHLPNTLSLVKTPVKLVYTMFETNKYPAFWEPFLKEADHVMVPTQFCADIMKDNFGVEAEIIPLGFDPDFFYYIDRTKQKDDHKFTFLHYDAFKWRKGWDLVFTAFNAEFGEEGGDDVQLIFKTTLPWSPPLYEYKKIKVIKGIYPQEEMIEILREADVFVFPSRGEGFGLTPLEAMATGMPAIFPNTTGFTHYYRENGYPLDVEPVQARYDNTELRKLDLGTYMEPTIASLRTSMRKAYEDWKTGRLTMEKSMALSEWAKQYSIENTTRKMCAVVGRYV